MTESTVGVIRQNDLFNKPGSVGKVLSGTQVKVVDTETGRAVGPFEKGEICFKGDCIMKGYIGNKAATDETIKNGWLHSGDIGYYDNDLEFFIVDRLKELIKYKGFQVAPAELEALLLQHPKIKDAAVIGKPDLEAGELPMAFVVRQQFAKNLSEQEVMDFVAKNVSSAKKLRGGVVFIDGVPKNPSGKILRRLLRDMLKNSNSKL